MQELVVGLIVAIAAAVVLQRYAPKSLKRIVRGGSVRLAQRLGWPGIASRLGREAEAGASCGDGCGSCGSCGTSTSSKGEQSHSISIESLKKTLHR